MSLNLKKYLPYHEQMMNSRKSKSSTARNGLSGATILVVWLIILIITFMSIVLSEYSVDRSIDSVRQEIKQSKNPKFTSDLEKVASEIRQVYSETRGGKFWINLIGGFVILGGAISGYLVEQSQATKAKLAFEGRKEVDRILTEIFIEFANMDNPVLRTLGAVKLGEIIENFPVEWEVSNERKEQIIRLIKNVLAKSLALEDDEDVQKVITISLARHYCIDENNKTIKRADLRGLDLTNAQAKGAYWAKANASPDASSSSYTDFYRANLQGASFREAILKNAQFCNSILTNAVLADADCEKANFKQSNLQKADLKGANLQGANFQGADLRWANLQRAIFSQADLKGAKVYGADIQDTVFQNILLGEVDISEEGDGAKMMEIDRWIAMNSKNSASER